MIAAMRTGDLADHDFPMIAASSAGKVWERRCTLQIKCRFQNVSS